MSADPWMDWAEVAAKVRSKHAGRRLVADLQRHIVAAVALHQDDGDGYCEVCCTPDPCETVRTLTAVASDGRTHRDECPQGNDMGPGFVCTCDAVEGDQ